MKGIFSATCIFLLSLFAGEYLCGQGMNLPDPPEIRYVSVDTANNSVKIFWNKSASPKVARYILYYETLTVNGYEGVKFDSVPASQNSYVHLNSGLAGNKPVRYSVSAVDTSAGYKNSTRSSAHSTIYSTVSYDSCNHTLTVKWNKYLGWQNNVSGYYVYEKKDGSSFKKIAGLNESDSSYVLYDIPENTNYSFFVEGLRNDPPLVSSSNICSKYTYMPGPPEQLSLDYLSVNGPQDVEIQYSFTDTSSIKSFALLRSSDALSEFEIIRSYNSILSSPQIIHDSIFTSVNRYLYKIAALNTCGSVIDTSNLGSNILLLGKNNEGINSLEWNAYRNFEGGTGSYEVYRIDTSGNTVLIASLTNQFTYSDDLSVIFGQNYPGTLSYKIRAVENGGNNSSFSNQLDLKVKSDVWLPTAFTPNADGLNDLFIPRLNFIPENYLMIIYDRFGTSVFSTKDPYTGWDGKINGSSQAPEGVYIYHIQYSSFNGQKVNKTGPVTVFYPR
ncbi:MAG: gliding motility-associated C-terminal domain-containing protein [Bacteroidales bacterium]|nr:gliding motility-associated C-terminal domain-containing protein [Bacteroidales bacterium]